MGALVARFYGFKHCHSFLCVGGLCVINVVIAIVFVLKLVLFHCCSYFIFVVIVLVSGAKLCVLTGLYKNAQNGLVLTKR